MSNEQAIVEVLERIRSRFYGKYRGVVSDVEQSGRGRIKAKVPAVLGDPCVPYAGPSVGIAFLPEVGSGVWIEFEGGDVSYPIWSGCYWRDGEIPSTVAPATKVIQIVSGNQIVFDDNGKTLTITDSNGNTVTLGASGITLQCANGGGSVQLTTTSVSVNDSALEVQVM
jgi:hypothetical protein